MYPITHMTIAVGSVWLGERLWRRFRGSTTDLASAIDYRFAALGSQIPDMIDKPLGKLGIAGLTDYETRGHSIGHTLLLPTCIILAGVLLASRRGDLRVLVLGIGCLTHPLVDPVNTYPKTLFWPLLGWGFPESTQAWRQYVQIPLDIALFATYSVAVLANKNWRRRAVAFFKRGTFPFSDNADSAAPS